MLTENSKKMPVWFLSASKETSRALKSKDVEAVAEAINNLNSVLKNCDQHLLMQIQSVDEQYVGR